MIFFWILWVIDAILTAIILYFFVTGLVDGSIKSRSAGIWLTLVLLPVILLVGGYILMLKNKLLAAKWLLSLLVIATFLCFLYLWFIVIVTPKWH